MQGTSAESQLDCAAQRWTLPRPILCSLCSSAAGLMEGLAGAGGRPPSPGGFGKFRRGGAHSSMSVCPNDRQCNGGEGKEMEPGSEKVRRSLPSHSEPSLPSHVRRPPSRLVRSTRRIRPTTIPSPRFGFSFPLLLCLPCRCPPSLCTWPFCFPFPPIFLSTLRSPVVGRRPSSLFA